MDRRAEFRVFSVTGDANVSRKRPALELPLVSGKGKKEAMNTIRIQARLTSTTLSLPELSPLLGRRVEIVVSEYAGDVGLDAIEALRSSPVSATAELFEEALVESGALSRLA